MRLEVVRANAYGEMLLRWRPNEVNNWMRKMNKTIDNATVELRVGSEGQDERGDMLRGRYEVKGWDKGKIKVQIEKEVIDYVEEVEREGARIEFVPIKNIEESVMG